MPAPAPLLHRSACGLLLLACAAVLLGSRLIAASALQRFDQPRTVSYTADIVLNGRWLIPRDFTGQTTTKPPLVNWLAAPVVALGFWTEWAVKWPMAAATLGTTALTFFIARRLFRRMAETRAVATEAACIAGLAWLVNTANVTMIYHCRPDPVLTAFLTAAWILGTMVITEEASPAWPIILSFWVCVGLAALTKGPAALVPVIYLVLAAWLIGKRPALVHRSRWWWGLPLALALFLCWAIPAATRYPHAFFNVLVKQQLLAPALGMGDRFGNAGLANEGPGAIITHIPQNPIWFMQRFAPWSLLTFGALCVIRPRDWFRHPLAPAVLWLLLVLAFFSLSARKTADYILPAYPAAAVLASYFAATFLQRWRIRLWHLGSVGVLLAIGFGLHAGFLSKTARHYGFALRQFADQVAPVIGQEPVIFVETGFNTLEFYLHRHQPGPATADEIAQAQWVIMPVQPGVSAALVSEPLLVRPTHPSRLALYRADYVRDRLVAKAPAAVH